MATHHNLPATATIDNRTYALTWEPNNDLDGWVAVIPGAAPAGLGNEIDAMTGVSGCEAWAMSHPVDGVDHLRVFSDGDVALHVRA